ncbi:hypothetical protein BABINDRAFT_161315 [Babjeviella inositovora NRRL Y-12698]|uniref:Serine/threonine-protein kinase MEC1 n=1 Tax=Babjeviella inositovora NRRL Y-12698 TaxID=984486 RepID=A0A1E3QTL4_9ASCO|nr:uncharacterized protein BABINDRAFT_161315 [Babjeviella inositovora NRRL Y-12698]ODQ80362.1 hypothetical protein BABINDRAFT_161315 [Babjeviella inositovora NRRL Y-12698]
MPTILTPTRQDYINKLFVKIINLSPGDELSEEHAVQILNTLSGQLARIPPDDAIFTQTAARQVLVRMFVLITTILERKPELLLKKDKVATLPTPRPGSALPFQVLAECMLPFLAACDAVASQCRKHLLALFALVSHHHPAHRAQLTVYLVADLLEQRLTVLLLPATLARLYAFRAELRVTGELFTLVTDADFRMHRVPHLAVQPGARWELLGRKLWYLLQHFDANFTHVDARGEPAAADQFVGRAKARYLAGLVANSLADARDYALVLVGPDPLPLISEMVFQGVSYPVLRSEIIVSVFKILAHARLQDQDGGESCRVRQFAASFNVEHFLAMEAYSDGQEMAKMLAIIRHVLKDCLSEYEEYQTDGEDGNMEGVAALVSTPFGDAEIDSHAQALLRLVGPTLVAHQVAHLLEDPSLVEALTHTALKDVLEAWVLRAELELGEASQLGLVRAIGNFLCLYSENYDLVRRLCVRCEEGNPNRLAMDTAIDTAMRVLLEIIKTAEHDPVMTAAVLLTLTKLFTAYTPAVSISAISPPIQPAKASTQAANASTDASTLAVASTLYRYVFSALTSPVREARVLAAHLVPLLLAGVDDNADLRALSDVLGSITYRDQPHLAEVIIMTWGGVAASVDGDGLLLALCMLVDFMGSSNPYHQTMAFHQLRAVSLHRGKKAPYQLLSPFWPVISFMVVKTMHQGSRVLLERVSELVALSPRLLLQRTAPYTVAHALTMYKCDVLQEIALACDKSKFQLTWEWKDRCLAKLLMDWDAVDEHRIMTVLRNACPEYTAEFEAGGNKLDCMITVNTAVWEVLKFYADNDPEDASDALSGKVVQRIRTALTFLAGKYGTYHGSDSLLLFFRTNILGVVQNFSEAINDTKGTQPMLEKERALCAIECMVQLCGDAVVPALPQINTCLQASMEVPRLTIRALQCWTALVRTLKDKDLTSLVHSILGIVLEKWDGFARECRREATGVLRLIFAREHLVQRGGFLSYMFTLASFPDLIDVYGKQNLLLKQKQNKLSAAYDLLEDICKRAGNDNAYVVSLALKDLFNYLRQYQLEFHDIYLRKKTFRHKLVPSLVSTLLAVADRYKTAHGDLATRAAECLGQIGFLDPTRFEAPESAARSQLIIVEDFADKNELTYFLLRFVNDVLVKRFWAASEPHTQLFLAYAMQEYLKRMGLDDAAVAAVAGAKKESEAAGSGMVWRIWNTFDDTAQSILTPLLSSRYTIKKSAHELGSYPFFSVGERHATWLRAFTLDMLRRGDPAHTDDSNAQHIFFVCTFLVKDTDLTVCRHILPYAVLHMVVTGDAATRANIRAELVLILQTDLAALHHHSDIDNMKSFLETVFAIMDYLKKWVAEANRYLKRGKLVDRAKIRVVEELVDSIPKDLLAKRSAQAGSFERAILYLEQCWASLPALDGKTDEALEHLQSESVAGLNLVQTLQSMYASIDDVDALNGVLTSFTTQTLDDKLLQFKYNDNWKMAQESYEALAHDADTAKSFENSSRLLESFNKHALYNRTLSSLDNRLTALADDAFPRAWVNYGLEAALHSGEEPTLRKWAFVADSVAPLRDPLSLTMYNVAQALVALGTGDVAALRLHLRAGYRSAGAGLSRAKDVSALANKPFFTLLHAIHDIDELVLTTHAKFDNSRRSLSARLANVGDDFSTNWQLLSMRKVTELLAKRAYVDADVADIWLTMARVSRKHARFDLSTKALMNAMVVKHPKTDLENAEMLWAQGDHPKALKLIETLRGDTNGAARDRAAVQLMYTQWLDVSSSSNTTTIVQEFARAIELDNVWEESYFHLAKYCNKVLDATRALPVERTAREDFSGEFEKKVVHNYGRAILCGPKYLYEALPKLVTIWLDFAAAFRDVPKTFERQRKEIADKRGASLYSILQDISAILARVPAFYWYTVFPQILSRICHPSEETRNLLVKIAATVASEYPKHALWSILAQAKSVLNDRLERGREVLNAVARATPAKSLAHAKQLFDLLFAVTDLVLPKEARKCSLRDAGFPHALLPCAELVAPLKQNFTVTLPASPAAVKNHTPFPQTSTVTFARVEDQADVITSLQRPKRLFYTGSDGRRYSMLCKKDDVRKDSKFMDLTVVLNRMLTANYECAKRKLEIETYAVVSLNEDHGIIEWVDNVKPLRTLIADKLKSLGHAYNYGKIGKMLAALLPFAERRVHFVEIIAEYPVVLPHWFWEQFLDPVAWYRARSRYARSCAVMSMVCYVLGIGDRHGENLLFRHTGALMHVDFDCIFEKGLTLAVPEVVPFRLTANMVAALGISGVEGTFRRLAELAMLLIRENETTLMNHLESFIYDPIMDWTRKGKGKNTPDQAMRTIRRKIRGVLDREGLPMSVQGQVEHIVQEATSVDKLCNMYHGWMPYM